MRLAFGGFFIAACFWYYLYKRENAELDQNAKDFVDGLMDTKVREEVLKSEPIVRLPLEMLTDDFSLE